MRKLAVKIGEKISVEAEATLQSTHQFKDELSERTQRAAELSTDYNRLCKELAALQNENMRLVKEILPSDAVLHKELQSMQTDSEELRRTLDSQVEEKEAVQRTRRNLEHKLEELDKYGERLAQQSEIEANLYRKTLQVEMVAIGSRHKSEETDANNMNSDLPEQYRINFLDLNQSATLTKNSSTSVRIDSSGYSAEGNPQHWAEFTRMLYETRTQLKARSVS